MNERSVNAWLLVMAMRHQPADSPQLSLQLVFGFFFFSLPVNYGISFFFFFENQLSLKMGLLIILLKNLILFSLKLILFELIYGVVWAIFGFRVQEFGADLCY